MTNTEIWGVVIFIGLLLLYIWQKAHRHNHDKAYQEPLFRSKVRFIVKESDRQKAVELCYYHYNCKDYNEASAYLDLILKCPDDDPVVVIAERGKFNVLVRQMYKLNGYDAAISYIQNKRNISYGDAIDIANEIIFNEQSNETNNKL